MSVMDDKPCAVEVHDLSVAYEHKPVLWDIDLRIPQGRLAAIVGPNGAGKTTLIKAMLGLIQPVSGAVFFPGLEPGQGGKGQGAPKSKTKKRLAYVPQSESVDWDFPATALDVVMMGRYGHLGWFKRPGRAEAELALAALQQVGMNDYAQRQISQLSGGQQRRVFLARALVQQADIYFMDEPFKGVDAQTEKTIVGLLKDLRSQGKTLIVVHHDLQTVAEYFDWLTLINLRVLANGPVQEVFNEQNLRTLYGGQPLRLQPLGGAALQGGAA